MDNTGAAEKLAIIITIATFITVYLRETGCEGEQWVYMFQDRIQWRGSCEKYNEISDSMKGQGTSLPAKRLSAS
jgi:hypothetical protein